MMPRTLRTSASLAVAAGLSGALLLVGCGSDHAGAQQSSAGRGEDRSIRDGSPVSPSPEPSVSPSSSGTSEERKTESAADKAERQRREAAPPGETTNLSPVTGIPEGGEHFGIPVTRKDDLTVYTPTVHGDALTIPVKVTNSGRKRAYYRFTIRVTGPDGFDATADASMDVVGLYPGTSWPTELTVRDAGHTPPEHPHITVESLERTEHGRS